jgi:hypothetical protein
VLAQATQPTTQAGVATTAPAPASAEALTPRGVLVAMAEAMQVGDAGRIRSLVYIEGQRDERIVSAVADLARVMVDVQHQAMTSLGAEGTRDLMGDTAARWQRERQKLQSATESIDGDTAAVATADGQTTILKRVDGSWRLSVASLTRDTDAAGIDRRLLEMEQQRLMLSSLVREIARGKYKSGEAARQGLHQKMAKWFAEQAESPSSRPTPHADDDDDD